MYLVFVHWDVLVCKTVSYIFFSDNLSRFGQILFVMLPVTHDKFMVGIQTQFVHISPLTKRSSCIFAEYITSKQFSVALRTLTGKAQHNCMQFSPHLTVQSVFLLNVVLEMQSFC